MDALFVSQSLGNGLAQGDPHVFHRMVAVHFQVPFGPHFQIHEGMDRQEGQHMVQEAHSGGDVRLAGTVQVQFHQDLGLFRIPFHFPLPHNQWPPLFTG